MFIEHNNTLITDPNRIANTFNDYFANIGTDLVSNKCDIRKQSNVYSIFLRSRNVLANLRNYTKMTF